MNTIEAAGRFRLADEKSEKNIRRALRGRADGQGRLPIIVINAEKPGVGKTALARMILKARFGECYASPYYPKSRAREIDCPATAAHGYILWEDVFGQFGKAYDDILTGIEMRLRVRSGERPVPIRVKNVQIVITGNNVRLSPDLTRRAIFINLL